MFLQLMNEDGERVGIISTNISVPEIKKHWTEFLENELINEDFADDIEEFIKYVRTQCTDNEEFIIEISIDDKIYPALSE